MSSHARPVRPSYHPCDLLKLYIYGYLNRVQSSRRLERKAGRNVEVMWLTGRLASGHKTIADFRMDNGLVMDVSRHEHWSVGLESLAFGKVVDDRDGSIAADPAWHPERQLLSA